MESRADYTYIIRRTDLKTLEGLGFNKASEMLCKTHQTKFEQVVFNAMSLYSHGVASRDVREKLVFSTAAVETLLLKDSREPIQGLVAHRLAYMVASDVDSRKMVIKNFKTAYESRSLFLHHGSGDPDFEVLKAFQISVWEAIRYALLHTDEYPTKEAFIEHLETIALAGPSCVQG